MKEYQKPVWWSVTKSLVGTVVAILEDRGLIDVSKPIDFYIEELKQSDFAGITVRNVLDMATGIDCSENYTDKNSCYYRYSAAIGDGFRDENSADNPYDMIATLNAGKWAEQGTAFDYSGVNTFVLGWLVERVTGMPFQDVLSAEIWSRIGAEGDASIFAPRYGIPVTHGGLLARPRDMARFGLLFTPSYRVVTDEPIVSDRYAELIRSGGNPKLLANARYGRRQDDSVSHNVYQWDIVYKNGDFYKGGWAGQGLYISPRRDLVAVYVGYFKDDDHSEVKPLRPLLEVLNGVFVDDESK